MYSKAWRGLGLGLGLAGTLSCGLMPGAALALPERIVSGAAGERLWQYCERLADFDFHGAVLVARDTHVVLLGAFGTSDPRTGAPNTTRTLFSTGSVTKQFTAAAVLELESQRKLSVEDPIARYLEGVPPDKQGIRIHHLLTHSAGLPDALGPDEEAIGRDSLVALAFAEPLLFEPGSSYEYSNVGYSLAAAIVERVSGRSYEDFLIPLWKKAGLTSTGMYSLHVPESEVSRSHNEAMGYPSQLDVPKEAWHLTGNGGMLSTPLDLFRWYRWLQADRGQAPKARRKMFTPYIKEGDMDSHYGYGWVIQESELRDGEMIWHNGGAMPHGWGCALYHLVKDSLVVVVFTNSAMQGRLPMDFIAAGLARHYFDSTAPLPPVVALDARLDTTMLSGTWDIKDGGAFALRVVDGRLWVEPRDQAAMTTLFPDRGPGDPEWCNESAARLIRLAARGAFDSAGALMMAPPGESATEFIRGWWSAFADLGAWRDVEVFGTRLGRNSRTCARLHFEHGTQDATVVWERGRCVALGPARNFHLELVPQSSDAFAGYDVASDEVTVAEFADTRLLIDRGGTVIKASRRK